MNVDGMNSPVGGSENAGGSKQGPISSNELPGQQEALVDSLAHLIQSLLNQRHWS